MKRTAAQLIQIIQQMCMMDIAYLGEDATVRKNFMLEYLSLAMHSLAKEANNVVRTDALTITADGVVDFEVGGVAVSDLFQPIRIIDSGGQEVRHNKNFTFPVGWYWEGSNSQIYVRGLSGDYTLHYIKYPAWITNENQIPDFPPSGYMALIYECAALIKQSKNFYEESGAMKQEARAGYGAIANASKAGGE